MLATAETVIAGLRRSCGRESNELVGLNLRNGKKLWSHPVTSPDGMMAVGGTIVGVEPENGGTVEGRGTVVGLDPRSGDAKWRWTMPTRCACPPRMESAGNLVLLISCPDAAEALTHTVVTAIDSGTGRMAWSATAATPADRRYAVTTDARVVFAGDTTDSCRLTSIGEHKVSYLTMTETEVPRCGRVVAAADNLILVRRRLDRRPQVVGIAGGRPGVSIGDRAWFGTEESDETH